MSVTYAKFFIFIISVETHKFYLLKKCIDFYFLHYQKASSNSPRIIFFLLSKHLHKK